MTGNVGTKGPGADWAERAFEAMAPLYDDFTAHHEYEFWTAQLLAVLEREGLQGRRLLDVGCGTGKSFLPMLPRGWQAVGCDISASMLGLAQQKVGDAAVRLEIADMRELPCFGEFDLVWALDDAINYLLSVEELEAALRGMRSNLATSGLLLFDVNELPVYGFYAEGVEVERDGRRFVFQGNAMGEVEPGSICEFSCFEKRPSGEGQAAGHRNVSVHRQRHFTEAEILVAIDRTGLTCLNVYGQSTDGIPRQPLDDSAHTKAIYVARAA